MKVIFETEDRDGVSVKLNGPQWKHITLGHPEMEEAMEAIRLTVEDPDVVARTSIRPRDPDGERRVAARLGTHPRYRGLWVWVPIEYCPTGNWVTTAYLSPLPPEGDLLYVRLPSR